MNVYINPDILKWAIKINKMNSEHDINSSGNTPISIGRMVSYSFGDIVAFYLSGAYVVFIFFFLISLKSSSIQSLRTPPIFNGRSHTRVLRSSY